MSYQIQLQSQDLQIVKYINLTFDSFLELRGDRKSGDDKTIIGGLARLGDYKVVIIGYQRYTKAPGPEGYRKCSRLMHLAEAFNKPVIVFVDALATTFSQASGQQWVDEAIARILKEMSCLMTPVISIIIGRSIDMCAADRVLILEGTDRSVPLLDNTSAGDVDTARLYSKERGLLDSDVVHRIVKGSSKGDVKITANVLRESMSEELRQLTQIHLETLVQQRLHRLQYQFLNSGASKLPSGNLNNAFED